MKITKLIIFLLLIITTSCKPDLPHYGKVKDFGIQNFDFEQVSNKVWIFNLFFTSCHGPCPRTMSNIRKIQDKYNQLHIVSLSVDPSRDSEQELKKYAGKLDIDSSKWSLLVASKEKTKEIINSNFEIQAQENVNAHSNRIFLIDKNKNIRGSYVGIVDLDMERLDKDLDKLL